MIKKLAPIMFALGAVVTALSACGDDDDDRLTEEEYLTQVDAILGDAFPRFEEEVLGAESARDGLEGLAAVAEDIEDGLNELEPPEDVEDLHDRYVEGWQNVQEFAGEQADEVEEDAPPEELEGILFGEDDPFAETTEVECELAAIAEERGVELENIFCDQAEGPEAAGDNPVPVEATEFEFSLDTLGPEDAEFSTETTGFVLTNAGEQFHEAFIVRIAEDADVDELLASEEEEPEGLEAEVGGTAAEPGGEAGFGFEEPLEPGRYLMLCFVEDEETGQPHALLGMVEEFTVE